ncbi:7-carboxy-7-deazaguanine synthase [Formicincola oecophyllae]|uniref:7-carboxy-7-deazaguanine synthase n=1 Tax=Formicincola oecophyllae TaxID=2558361 RepID=UPI00143D0A55|nr:7-carboxy-7-deazaguanine synthase [Formicincola oecophyllae]
MVYSVKEIFPTLQGEGFHTGRAAVFCRFAGCNLWNGREGDRAHALCRFCDTDFIGTDGPGGGRFHKAADLAQSILQAWQAGTGDQGHASCSPLVRPYVVFTGGEPLLQLDQPLIQALKQLDFEVGVESNGTLKAPLGIDWLCISPKGRAPLVQASGDELKFIYPQTDASPELFTTLPFKHFWLQPLDIPAPSAEAGQPPLRSAENVQAAVRYCQTHPQWRLSLQTHKLIGIP